MKKLSLWSILCIAVAVACGLVALADHIIDHPTLSSLTAILLEGVMILAAFALLLGIVNLLITHGRHVFKPAPSNPSPDASVTPPSRTTSIILLIGLLGTIAVGLAAPCSGWMGWLFDYIYFPIQATIAALLAFSIVHALFRAYQLRSLDAVLLLVGSIGMLLMQTPWASALWPSLPLVGEWVLGVPVAAILRGVIIGASLGVLSTTLRVLTAVDRPYLGE